MRAARRGDLVYLELTPRELDMLIAALAFFLARHPIPTPSRDTHARLLRKLSQTPSTGTS